MKRTRVLAAKTALAIGAVALGLAGCSVTSPAVIKTPYPASDGIDADLPGTQVVLRNLLVVGAEKGGPAELIGSVINRGTSDARIQLQAATGETGQPSQTTVAVAAGESVQFGPGANQTEVAISELAVEPGDITGLTASTTSGGRVDLNLPVMPPEGTYAGVTAAPTPSATPTATPTGNGKGKGKGNGQSPDATGTPEVSGTAAEETAAAEETTSAN
ncbi:hypothetical protein [Kineosporia sp. NBRC 101731]|uniref:hypothetical protein n=1 Tax=Kineosporia sp. NBRC 101731 TaxID=3032199 RepID=UPI0024A0CED9|nr:hypothetical protein [Kineosporia sp. NBRC 101731]GLY27509.1 hypothetical protein Kisp02_08740 [Kineosporia sp. NBRC 101731]